MSLQPDQYGKRTLDFVQKLQSLTGYDEICREIAKEMEWYGFDYVSSWSMPGPGDDPADCLLLVRYLDVPPPYLDVYRPALAALDTVSQSAHRKSFSALDEQAAINLVRTMSETNPEGWQGPPAPLFYFALRSDAVDVVYGTEEGFERLGIPYMAHIRPTAKW